MFGSLVKTNNLREALQIVLVLFLKQKQKYDSLSNYKRDLILVFKYIKV